MASQLTPKTPAAAKKFLASQESGGTAEAGSGQKRKRGDSDAAELPANKKQAKVSFEIASC